MEYNRIISIVKVLFYDIMDRPLFSKEKKVKKRLILIGGLLCLGALLWAKAGDTMYVNVEEAELKSGTGFFSSSLGYLPYGAKVTILHESGKWTEVVSVDNSKISGWLPASSLTKKKILADDSLNRVSASADELALAGKGFSAEVEALYTTESNGAIYQLVDDIESTPIDKSGLWEFIQQGALRDGSGVEK